MKPAIRPVAGFLDGIETLQIVPDGALFDVPFAALYDDAGGRYLIEDHRIAIAPELRLASPAGGRRSFSRAAVFGDPGSAAGRGGKCGPLVAARAEARRIHEELGPETRVERFEGRRATPSAFLSALAAYDLVHFAGHGVVDRMDPLSSHLVLAPEAGSPSGTLTARELYERSPQPMPSVVVLASCDGAATGRRLSRASALVRPLLDLGAGAVVGSLEPIPDEELARLMGLLYAGLREEPDPVAALSRAQAAIAEAGPGQGAHWGSLQVYRYL